MPQLQGLIPDFAGLYAKPTIQRLLSEIDDHQFEHFVKYVFEQAGYFVEDTAGQRGPGLDLKLYVGQPPAHVLHAGVQVKQLQPGSLVVAPDVLRLHGGLAINGGVTGYFVTTSGFGGPALTQAQPASRIWPIDGDHLLRYIDYVRGSRPDPATTTSNLSVPAVGGSFIPIPPEALFTADAIPFRPVTATKVITISNHKGGVGKTTTALNLAFGLAGHDQQVLLVDLDSQMNLTRELVNPHAQHVPKRHVGQYFAGQCDLSGLVQQTQFPRVWLLPSDHALSRSDTGVAAGPDAELQFVRDLHAPNLAPPRALDTRPFDWIIIDTGPWMGRFTRSALAASHFVIIPIAPGVFADMGLVPLIDTVKTMSALTGRPIEIMGGLVTQWQDNALNRNLLVNATNELANQGVSVLATKIPLDKANIEKAHLETAKGQRRNLFNHSCASARAYAAVVEEVMA